MAAAAAADAAATATAAAAAVVRNVSGGKHLSGARRATYASEWQRDGPATLLSPAPRRRLARSRRAAETAPATTRPTCSWRELTAMLWRFVGDLLDVVTFVHCIGTPRVVRGESSP
jgi:hypothetical protein